MIEGCTKSRGKIGRMRSTGSAVGNRTSRRMSVPGTPSSADDEESRDKSGYELPLAAVSVGPLEEADLFILRSGKPEIGEGDGDLN